MGRTAHRGAAKRQLPPSDRRRILQRAQTREYIRLRTSRFYIRLDTEKHAALIAWIRGQGNMQRYLVSLAEADMRKKNRSRQKAKGPEEEEETQQKGETAI
jgi:hypothetical protein